MGWLLQVQVESHRYYFYVRILNVLKRIWDLSIQQLNTFNLKK